MGTPRFFIEALVAGRVVLSPEESQHVLRVRRLSAGDQVVLFDGQGQESQGRIMAASRQEVVIDAGVISFRDRLRPQLVVGFAPPKEPRQDVLVEKCTELGVAELVPLLCERAVAGVSGHRLEKWRRKAVEAAKQSGQCWLPRLHAPRTLAQVLADRASYGLVLVGLSPGDGVIPEPIVGLLDALAGAGRVLALVGPEGGWEPGEVSSLLAAGVTPVSLGPNTLRIETAAVAMAVVVHALAQRRGMHYGETGS
ncbi:MAG: 16S rRNA (uracil(1498)-N(3))-methyltransferase [Phycisphaerae bacterium]|nr:16S rRNA (uracil(1498)-N(3))-methyltransferase [Phycisphaerae bacterium]